LSWTASRPYRPAALVGSTAAMRHEQLERLAELNQG
jgi:hypothetical protein